MNIKRPVKFKQEHFNRSIQAPFITRYSKTTTISNPPTHQKATQPHAACSPPHSADFSPKISGSTILDGMFVSLSHYTGKQHLRPGQPVVPSFWRWMQRRKGGMLSSSNFTSFSCHSRIYVRSTHGSSEGPGCRWKVSRGGRGMH